MNALEKILEEIDNRKSYHEEKAYKQDDYEIQKMYCSEELDWITNIIRSHMNDIENDGWIQVEEKLPEEENERYYPMLNVSTSYGAVKWGFYRVRDKQWYIYSEIHDEFIEARDKEIVAWQPLPEGYKGE